MTLNQVRAICQITEHANRGGFTATAGVKIGPAVFTMSGYGPAAEIEAVAALRSELLELEAAISDVLEAA